jgi:hypothetical protein
MSPVNQGVYVQQLSLRIVPLAALFASVSHPLTAQSPPTDSTPPVATQQAPSSSPRPFAFSGVLYLNYQYGGPANSQSANRFDVDRAYLNFRASAGSRDSIRVTADVFQQRDPALDDYYAGWAVRIKYAYLNHEFVTGPSNATRVFGRIGILQTVVIEKEEQYWNRGLSQAAVEQAGYFNSADAGAAAVVSLPNRLGEVYATIVNGNGYASRETDRFKDFQARVSISPWANSNSVLRGLEFSPWVSVGGRASTFATGQGTLNPVTEAQRKDRFGFFTGYRNSRLVAGLQLGRRIDVSETADTTTAVVPTSRTVTGNLVSNFAFWRPLGPATRSPWTLLYRVDHITPDDTQEGTQRRYIVGTTWDVSSRTSVTFDVQSLSFRNGLPGTNARTYFLHVIANF